MPICTELERNGELVTLPHGWGGWHVQVLREAMVAEGVPEDQFFAGFPQTPYTFTKKWIYEDTSDGEIFEILPGDIYRAWRN